MGSFPFWWLDSDHFWTEPPPVAVAWKPSGMGLPMVASEAVGVVLAGPTSVWLASWILWRFPHCNLLLHFESRGCNSISRLCLLWQGFLHFPFEQPPKVAVLVETSICLRVLLLCPCWLEREFATPGNLSLLPGGLSKWKNTTS